MKGIRLDWVRGGRKEIAAWGYRGQQGTGEQVKGKKTESAGQAVQACRKGHLFGQAVQDRNDIVNQVQRMVQLNLRMADERGSQYTEDKGEVSRKQFNCGTGIDKT